MATPDGRYGRNKEVSRSTFKELKVDLRDRVTALEKSVGEQFTDLRKKLENAASEKDIKELRNEMQEFLISLTRNQERDKNLSEKVKYLEDDVYGGGREGLKERVQSIETTAESNKERLDALDNLKKEIFMKVLGGAAGITAAIEAIAALINNG